MIKRKKTMKIKIGDVEIGGGSPIAVQSMTKVKTEDVDAVCRQVARLERAGCEIIRVAVPNRNAAKAIRKIKKRINIPLVADIHFDYRLALEAIDSGADKVRLNPGNIYDEAKVKKVIRAAKSAKIPIRIGANSGSILRKVDRVELEKGKKTKGIGQIMVERVMEYLRFFEKEDFSDIVVSLKAPDVLETIEAYELMSKRSDYPLHLGITAAGTSFSGTIKSALGIGSLLLKGIGDTIRVSLTGDPTYEVRVAKEILQSLGIRLFGPIVVSCPTCSRTQVDIVPIVEKFERRLKGIDKAIKIAIMGCEVNGPGEARDADIGIAAGKSRGLLFKKGKPLRKVKEEDFIAELLKEIREF